MNRIGLSFYICFIALILATVVGIATLAQGFAPLKFEQFASPTEIEQAASPPAPPKPAAAPAPTETKTSTEVPAPPETAIPDISKDVANAPPAPPANEAEYRKLLRAHVAALVKPPVSDSDRKALTAALRAVRRGNASAVAGERQRVSSLSGRKLVDWMMLRAGLGNSAQISAFLAANANWPDRQLLVARLEEHLFFSNPDPQQTLSNFQNASPATSVGKAALASAHLRLKSIEKAKALAGEAWCSTGIKARHEKEFLARFAKHLTQADHQCRLDRMLVTNLRWNSSRTKRGAQARRHIPRLDKSARPKATAR
ncbi:MAG: hypothetical protein ACR2OV_15755, partial [Hyphomicrobiaceae bacterium]